MSTEDSEAEGPPLHKVNVGQEVPLGCWGAGVWRAAGVQMTPRTATPSGLWFAVMSSTVTDLRKGTQLPRSDTR